MSNSQNETVFCISAFLETGLGNQKFVTIKGIPVFNKALVILENILKTPGLNKIRNLVGEDEFFKDFLVFQVGNYLLSEEYLESPRISRCNENRTNEEYRLEAIDSAKELLSALDVLERFDISIEMLLQLIEEMVRKSERHFILETYLRSTRGFVKCFFGDTHRLDIEHVTRGLSSVHEASFILHTEYIVNDILELGISQKEMGLFCKGVLEAKFDKESTDEETARQWYKNYLSRHALSLSEPDNPTWIYWRTVLGHKSLEENKFATVFKEHLEKLSKLASDGQHVSGKLVEENEIEIYRKEKYWKIKKDLASLAQKGTKSRKANL